MGKVQSDDIVTIGKTTDGKLVWLEEGNDNAGLKHIFEGMKKSLKLKGLKISQIYLNKILASTPKKGTNIKGYTPIMNMKAMFIE